MAFRRSSGILAHPSSFPSRHGIGDFGNTAYEFLDFLRDSKQGLWQILPLSPTGYADSPYQSFSAFAGNPMLISLDSLKDKGLLNDADVKPISEFSDDLVNYGPVITYKTERLQRAYRNFGTEHNERGNFDEFCQREADWLDDYALFMALKIENEWKAWVDWEAGLVHRQPAALNAARERLADAVGYQKFLQWAFYDQWWKLRWAAGERQIKIMGDLPLFIAHDSADAWANPDQFFLDEHGNPTVVAGVPPDYFSATGQRWGNPLYRWEKMETEGFAWWMKRLRGLLKLVDIIRIDHFRGLESYWEIPADEPTAINGKWIKAPGDAFFRKIQDELGHLPLIAEDLGLITQAVTDLRERFAIPGMKVLQFAFGEKTDHAFLPHNYETNTVVYTGTHDNETIAGWYHNRGKSEDENQRREFQFATQYANVQNPQEAHWDFIRLAWASVANTALIPIQDVLGVGDVGRMNMPGREGGNWQWRYRREHLTPEHANRLRHLTELYGRAPDSPQPEDKQS